MNETIFLLLIIACSIFGTDSSLWRIAFLLAVAPLWKTFLNSLQDNQQTLLARIEMNARLEKEIVATFAQRQAELRELDSKLEQRANDLRRLMAQAEGITRSPQLFEGNYHNGKRKGLSSRQIAKMQV